MVSSPILENVAYNCLCMEQLPWKFNIQCANV